MSIKILLPFFLMLSVSGCDLHARSYESAEPISINRFDQKLFSYVQTKDTTLREALISEYPVMLDLVGKGILNIKSIDTPGFFEKLISYYSNPDLAGINRDALDKYSDISHIEKQLGEGFAYLTDHFPSMVVPQVYMHVSGFNQNILTGERTLSLSIDKYMGYDYRWYEQFFYDYQRLKMQPEYIVADYMAGWLMSEYPFEGKENVLLDRMIYAGKIKYLVHQACPEMTEAQLMGYADEEYGFMESNMSIIWKTIIERKHLYTPDHITTGQYFEEQPSRFISDNAPGNIGTFIGWQIIERYMKESKSTPEQLMQQHNAQEILTVSRFKP